MVAEIKPGWARNSEIIHLLGPGSKYFFGGASEAMLSQGLHLGIGSELRVSDEMLPGSSSVWGPLELKP